MTHRERDRSLPMIDYGHRGCVDWVRILAWLLPPALLGPLGVWLIYISVWSRSDIQGHALGTLTLIFFTAFGAVCVFFGIGYPLGKIIAARRRPPLAQLAEGAGKVAR